MYDDFDVYASDYREVHSKNVQLTGADSFYFAGHKVRWLQNKERNDGLNWLDLGCGDGTLTELLEHAYPQSDITGADVSFDSIMSAQKKSLNARFIHYEGNRLPFENKQFDVVLLAAVLHHVRFEAHAALIKEVKRVLKPGGRAYVFEHNPYHPGTRYIVKTCIFDKDARLLKPSYAKKIFEESGFEYPVIRYTLFFPRWGGYRLWETLENAMSNWPLGAQYVLQVRKPLGG